MRVLMFLLLTQSSWSVKAMTDEPEMLIKSDVYNRETGQKLDAGMFTLKTLEDRSSGCIMKNYVILGGDLEKITSVASIEECKGFCVSNSDCSHFSFYEVTNTCLTKGMKALKTSKYGDIAGTKLCAENSANIKNCIEQNTDYPGLLVRYTKMDTVELCQKSCLDNGICGAWTYRPRNKSCWHYSMSFLYFEGFFSGFKNCH